MNKTLITLSAVALTIAAFPGSTADTTLVDMPLGASLDANFDDDNGGWTASPVVNPPPPPRPAASSTWAWGQVGYSGKPAAASGVNVWATNLTGTYKASDCGAILSPAIDLTGATSASVSFKQWRHIEESTTSTSFAWDAGMLFVTSDGGYTFTVVTPDGGYTSKQIGSTSRTCLDGQPSGTKGLSGPAGTTVPPMTYSTINVDLSAHVGTTVQFAIAFASDSVTHRAGWVIDDFATTINGVTTVEDFESSDGGFTIVGTKVAPTPPPAAEGWEWGTPTNGPGPVSAMWATNVDGKHGANECAWVESPAFQVGELPSEAGAVVKATLSWKQWFKSSTTTGAGVVQIGTSDGYKIVTPTTGYPASPTSTVLDACLGHLAGGQGAFAGTTLNPTVDMIDYAADISGYAGETITVRFVFATTSSTTVYEGWYVDDVRVDTSLFAAAPDVQPPPLNPGDLHPSLGQIDPTLWTVGGTNPTWAYGEATNGPGGTAWATNLNGNYANSECSYIESPSIDATHLGLFGMTMKHWHQMESLASSTSWDGGVVMISTDEGATWQWANTTGYNDVADQTSLKACLTSHGVDVTTAGIFSHDSFGTQTVTVDVSPFVGAAKIKVRFVFGSDSSVTYPGWYISDVRVAGYDAI